MTKPLTSQQDLFARRLAEGMSQAGAYREAYPRSQHWKPDSVHSKASELAADVRVSERVAQLRGEAARRTGVTQDQIINELANIAFFDIRRLFNGDGSLKRVQDLDGATAAAIASIEVVDIGGDGQLTLSKKFKTAGKLKALELLGVNIGMFVKQVKDVTDPLDKAMANMTPEEAKDMLVALAQVRNVQEKARGVA